MYLLFVSSLVKNFELAIIIKNKLSELGKKSELINLVELDIPMYDSYKEQNEGIPQKIIELAKKMEVVDGFIFISPEYNYSLPVVHINTIAWLSRIGDDFRKLFSMKYIQLATHSGSGGQDVCNTMRTQFSKLGAIVMPREIITSYQKELNNESLNHILKQFINTVK